MLSSPCAGGSEDGGAGERGHTFLQKLDTCGEAAVDAAKSPASSQLHLLWRGHELNDAKFFQKVCMGDDVTYIHRCLR